MKKVAALLVLALASVALVACGSSSSSSSTTATTGASESGAAAGGGEKAGSNSGGGGGQTLKVEADPNGQLAYTQKTLSAKAGNVTVDFKNPQALEHDVAIEGSNGKIVGKTELVGEGATSSTAVKLKPGTYHFFCTVPGHRQAGMEGTLTVK